MSKHIVALFASLTLISTAPTSLAEPVESLSRTALSYIPEATVGYAYFRPHETLTHPLMKYVPTELLTALSIDAFNLDPMKIESIDLVVGTPVSQGGDLGFVVKMTDSFDMQSFASQLGAETPIKLKGVEYYQPPKISKFLMKQIGPKEFVAGTKSFTQLMMKGKHSTGRLSSLASNTKSSHTSFLFAVDALTLRPFLKDATVANRHRAPEFADLFDQVVSNSDLIAVRGSVDALGMQIYFEAANDSNAVAINSAFATIVSEFERALISRVANKSQANVVDVAMAQYSQRVIRDISNELKPKRSGNRVIVQPSFREMAPRLIASGIGLSLVGGIDGARTANSQLAVPGNLKQLGKAILEYEAATGQLPSNIVDPSTGTPLLSWRVAILPFLGYQELYLQFHLNEPWDSPHNLELSSQMPKCLMYPSCPSNSTTYLAPSGPNLGVLGLEFTDIRDGASDTAAVINVPPNEAVHWTQPKDIEISAERPFAHWETANVREIYLIMADSTVRSVNPHKDAPSSFYDLLTPNGNAERKRKMEVSRKSKLASSGNARSIE